MSDRMPAQITIGGTIKRSLVEELCEVITDSGAGPDWEGGCKVTDEDGLRRLVGQDGTIVLCNCEACYGHFEELEQFLLDHRIPFDRNCDAKYEYDGELVRYRPESGVHEYLCTQDGRPSVTIEEIEEVVKQLDGLEDLPHEQLLGVAESVREDLRGMLAMDVPPVPPLVIVEG